MFIGGTHPQYYSYKTADPAYDAIAGALEAIGYDVTVSGWSGEMDTKNNKRLNIAHIMTRLDAHCSCGVEVDFDKKTIKIALEEDVYGECVKFNTPEDFISKLPFMEAIAFDRLVKYMAQ